MRRLQLAAFLVVVALEGQLAALPGVADLTGHALVTRLVPVLTDTPGTWTPPPRFDRRYGWWTERYRLRRGARDLPEPQPSPRWRTK